MKNFFLILISLSLLSCAGSDNDSGGSGNSLKIDTWTRQTSGLAEFEDLEDVIWCDELSMFVAVGFDSVATSPDGISWTTNVVGDGWGLIGVTYNETQNKFVAVGLWGTVITSTDGDTWEMQNADNASFSCVTCSDNLYVAAGTYYDFVDGNKAAFFSSIDGETWEVQEQFLLTDAINEVKWCGSQFVAVGDADVGDGMNRESTVYTSPDGEEWTKHTIEINSSLKGVAWNGSFYIAVGDSGTALKSTDGETWTDISPSEMGHHLEDIIWNGTYFIAITTYDDEVLASPDGVEITTVVDTNSIAGMFNSIAWNGERFVIVGSNQTIITAP